MAEPDMTDDWMDPPRSHISWTSTDRTKTPWLIERQKRVQGPITQWDVWSYHATREERDAELAKLIEAHPMWSLRSGYYQRPMAIL